MQRYANKMEKRNKMDKKSKPAIAIANAIAVAKKIELNFSLININLIFAEVICLYS